MSKHDNHHRHVVTSDAGGGLRILRQAAVHDLRERDSGLRSHVSPPSNKSIDPTNFKGDAWHGRSARSGSLSGGNQGQSQILYGFACSHISDSLWACRMRCRTKSTSAWLLITSQTPSHASTCDHPFASHPSPSDVIPSLASCWPRLASPRLPPTFTRNRRAHAAHNSLARRHGSTRPPVWGRAGSGRLLRTIPHELIAGLAWAVIGRGTRRCMIACCMLYAPRTHRRLGS
jgi:hypothetical protein